MEKFAEKNAENASAQQAVSRIHAKIVLEAISTGSIVVDTNNKKPKIAEPEVVKGLFAIAATMAETKEEVRAAMVSAKAAKTVASVLKIALVAPTKFAVEVFAPLLSKLVAMALATPKNIAPTAPKTVLALLDAHAIKALAPLARDDVETESATATKIAGLVPPIAFARRAKPAIQATELVQEGAPTNVVETENARAMRTARPASRTVLVLLVKPAKTALAKETPLLAVMGLATPTAGKLAAHVPKTVLVPQDKDATRTTVKKYRPVETESATATKIVVPVSPIVPVVRDKAAREENALRPVAMAAVKPARANIAVHALETALVPPDKGAKTEPANLVHAPLAKNAAMENPSNNVVQTAQAGIAQALAAKTKTLSAIPVPLPANVAPTLAHPLAKHAASTTNENKSASKESSASIGCLPLVQEIHRFVIKIDAVFVFQEHSNAQGFLATKNVAVTAWDGTKEAANLQPHSAAQTNANSFAIDGPTILSDDNPSAQNHHELERAVQPNTCFDSCGHHEHFERESVLKPPCFADSHEESLRWCYTGSRRCPETKGATLDHPTLH